MMKKKIKDLTLEEMIKICHKSDNCGCHLGKCPFINYEYCDFIVEAEKYNELDKEVEVDEILRNK